MNKLKIAIALLAAMVLLGCVQPEPEPTEPGPGPIEEAFVAPALGTGESASDLSVDELEIIEAGLSEMVDLLNSEEDANLEDLEIDEALFA